MAAANRSFSYKKGPKHVGAVAKAKHVNRTPKIDCNQVRPEGTVFRENPNVFGGRFLRLSAYH